MKNGINLENTEQLKELIHWCKINKIKKVELGDVKFEISELSFISEEHDSPEKPEKLFNSDTLADTDEQDPKDFTEDPDLFWSSN